MHQHHRYRVWRSLGSELSRYDGRIISEDRLGVALPFFFRGPRPKVRVINPATGRSVVCDIVDVRPWNTNDPYWETGSRPQAEAGVARDARKTNLAGIDLTRCSARCRHRRQGTGGLEFAGPSEFAGRKSWSTG